MHRLQMRTRLPSQLPAPKCPESLRSLNFMASSCVCFQQTPEERELSALLVTALEPKCLGPAED